MDDDITPSPVTPWIPPIAAWAIVGLPDGTLRWLIGAAPDVIAAIEVAQDELPPGTSLGARVQFIASAN